MGKNKVRGVSGLNTFVDKTCPECGFTSKIAETKNALCIICSTLHNKKVVMIEKVTK